MDDEQGTRDAPEGRARDLTRARRRARPAPTSTRRHHIGAAPDVLPVLRPDGTVGTTRTSALQLADRTPLQLERLAAELEADMARAADALDFEAAAHLRDELAAVRAELARRGRA